MHIKPEAERVVGYVRRSAHDQAGHGTSLAMQEAQIRADADAKGQSVVRIFVEASKSGHDADRPERDQMLEYVEEATNNIREIKIFSLSRLCRNMEAQSQMTARVNRAGVRMLSLIEG